MEEVDHVLNLLNDAKKASLKSDVLKLKHLSNQTIHTASITGDKDNISVAVIIYALSKLIERKAKYYDEEYHSFLDDYIKAIDEMIILTKKRDFSNFEGILKNIISRADNLSENLKITVEDLFRKAKINKASKVYEHGFSLERTANLLGISLWELADYAGQAGISEMPLTVTLDVKKRIKNALDFFEKE
ncbi:MAG: hypothetical protein QXJ28_02235 [Candidatus Pacearchaeota archaeon]